MVTPDARMPVIVGVAHVDNRTEDAAEPIAMMEAAARHALDDAGVAPASVDMIRVVRGIWPYADPGRVVADRLGATDATTSLGVIGGNEMFDLVNETARRIQDGELDVAVICAAENLRTRRRDRARGGSTEFLTEHDGAVADEPPRETGRHGQGRELETGATASAVSFYALVETAIRHRRGESVADHRQRIARLWASASAVAADNPDAWLRDPKSAEAIATPSEGNRWVSYPYPKLMTSNVNVDQGGAVVLTSTDFARRNGARRDGWVYPHSGLGAHDHWFATNRWALDESPAMRLAGRRTLALAEIGIDDCKYIDTYSCFPAAVQLAHRELGLDEERDFTITGGLTFAGGPLNCYCMLSLVRAVRLLRDDPQESAFITGNGGFFTKHSFLTLSGRPASSFRTGTVQAEIDELPRRVECPAAPARATIEGYTVMFDRDGAPERSAVACLTAAGERWWGGSTDPDLARALIADDRVGREVSTTDDTVHLL